jgi:hypothetical protein
MLVQSPFTETGHAVKGWLFQVERPSFQKAIADFIETCPIRYKHVSCLEMNLDQSVQAKVIDT